MSASCRTRILVVDDNALTRHALVDELSETYDVVFAANPGAATRVMSATKPDVIIGNLTLPGLESEYLIDGLAAASDVPLIAVTCDCDSGQRAHLLRHGVSEVLTHPVTISELGARVDGFVAAERRHDALKAKLRTQREILAQAAHDLRNPLNTIALTVEALADIAADADQAEVMRDRVHRASDRMRNLIQAVITAGTGQSEALHREALRPEDAIDAVLELNIPIAASKGVRLQRAVAGALPTVQLDKTRFARVLDNLVANAVKFTQRGGCVAIGAATRGNSVIFSVADTGTGIPSGDVAHIFEAGWQATPAKCGHGLGLAIAKSVVDAHGGRLWVKSVVGSGSTFYAAFPLSQTQQPQWQGVA